MKILAILCFLLFGGNLLVAQSFAWDIGGHAGIANYFGDLAEEPGFNSTKIYQRNTRYNAGFFMRYRPAYRYAFNFQLNYINVTGADSLNPNSGRTSRNLHFRNNIFELSARAEYYAIIVNDVGGKKRYKADFHFYVFGGVGALYHNPQAQLNGKWHNLRPLQTEATSYSPVTAAIPVGLGFFFTLKTRTSRIRRHRIGMELNYRKLFTDYLDDVSTTYRDISTINDDLTRDIYARAWELNQDGNGAANRNYPGSNRIRGNPNRNDAYATITFSYSYVITTGRGKFYRPKYNYMTGSSKKRRSKF